jgi:hypothetical protein
MSTAEATMLSALEVAQQTAVQQAQNGVCYAVYGDVSSAAGDVLNIVEAVPKVMAQALSRKAYFFVPLALPDGDRDTPLISSVITEELSERAVCHRNVTSGASEMVFISTGIMADRFALAFEFFINVGHGFVDNAGVSPAFTELAWKHAEQDVRGETSQDAHESRKRARQGTGHNAKIDEKARGEFFEAAFADAIAVYLLSLTLDVDYYELREREYPLLAPRPLGERLRKVAELFPPNPGYEFAVKYRRRG